ncbi:MAG: DUF937 domain-containing protein [Hyphomicrobiaceae bacterium]
MQLLDQVFGPNNTNLNRLSQGLDLTEDETAAVVRSVIPEITHYLERETISRGGLARIIQVLGDSRQQEFLADEADLTSPQAVDRGNDLLGQILQTKYRSRAVADQVERETGVPAIKTRQMLPRIANMSMGALQQNTRPALEDIFKKLPGFQENATASSPGQNPGSSPLPIPGDDWGGRSRNGYDDLSDVLRRKQRPFQSNPLWNIARQILGSVLGFQSKGILGYIIRFIVYRYGWSILRVIFGRLFRT